MVSELNLILFSDRAFFNTNTGGSFQGHRPLDPLGFLQHPQIPSFFSFIACVPLANHDESKIPIIPYCNMPPPH